MLVIPYFRYDGPRSSVLQCGLHMIWTIIESGDQLYKILKINNMLSEDDLPRNVMVQSTLDISNCQGTNKFVRDIESSTYRVVILCKLIRMEPIFLFETSSIRDIEIRL